MLRRLPTTADTANAEVLLASDWMRELGGKRRPVPARSGVYTCETRPREGREVVRGSCIVGRSYGPGSARRQRGLWGAGRTVSARTPGSLLPDSRFDRGRGGRSPGDPCVGLAGSERVRGTSIAQKLAVSRRDQSVPRCLASMA